EGAAGTNPADARRPPVARAGIPWAETATNKGLEPATLAQYRDHLKHHIVPLIGGVKLTQLTAPMVRGFEDRLAQDRSPAMVRKVMTSLGSILPHPQQPRLLTPNLLPTL